MAHNYKVHKAFKNLSKPIVFVFEPKRVRHELLQLVGTTSNTRKKSMFWAHLHFQGRQLSTVFGLDF